MSEDELVVDPAKDACTRATASFLWQELRGGTDALLKAEAHRRAPTLQHTSKDGRLLSASAYVNM